MKILTGRYIPGNSLMHRLDPRAKLFGFLILIAAVIFTDSLIGYAVLFVAVLYIAFNSGVALVEISRAVWAMMPFYVIIFVMNALFYKAEDPYFSFWIVTLSKEGLTRGANVVLRIAIIIILSSILTTTTPAMGIMYALETLVRPLKYLGLPAEEIAMILSIAIQFIPTLMEESDTIRKAQIARGARFESGKLRERAMAMMPMIVPIFISAFRRADELSIAMEARGYRGAKNRTEKEVRRMDSKSWAALAVCIAICAAEVVL